MKMGQPILFTHVVFIMAKRKTKNKSFASRRAAEAAEREQQDSRQTIITWLVGLAVAIGVIIGILILLPVLFDNSGEEAETAAVDTTAAVENEATVLDGEIMASDRPLASIPPAERNAFYSAAPETVIDTTKSYEAVIETTQGTMRLALYDDQAPVTVNNFVFLANQGFYDGTIFHRVIDGFMAQGGDPTGSGAGGPGYQFEDEFDPEIVFDRRGLLAMANSGPATNGSQFFITFDQTSWLNGAHTIFGEIVEGDDVLGAITITDGVPNAVPDEIIRIDIVEG